MNAIVQYTKDLLRVNLVVIVHKPSRKLFSPSGENLIEICHVPKHGSIEWADSIQSHVREHIAAMAPERMNMHRHYRQLRSNHIHRPNAIGQEQIIDDHANVESMLEHVDSGTQNSEKAPFWYIYIYIIRIVVCRQI